MRLKPYHVFRGETTRLNELYWTSRYAYERAGVMIRALASVGHVAADPRVDEVWPSTDPDVSRHITVSASSLAGRTESLLAGLRATAVLHVCSAFETALTNYLALGLMYRPVACKSLKAHDAVPGILAKGTAYQALRQAVLQTSSGLLHGPYSKRLQEFETRFGLSLLAKVPTTDLDNSYSMRHLVAHDQSLDAADQLDHSPDEVLASALQVSEADWKSMLRVFFRTVEELDGEMQRLVIADLCAPLAVYRCIQRRNRLKLGEMRHIINHEWHFDLSNAAVLQAAQAADMKITKAKALPNYEVYV